MKLPLQSAVIPVNIEGIPFSIHTIENTGAYLNAYLEEEDADESRIPYWVELWPSSLVLAQYLLQHPELVTGGKVLEIGCGLGVAGLAAAHVGAEVLFTDNHPHSLEFARYNWQKNGSPGKASFTLMDWQQPDPALAAPVLIGSDVSYEKRFHPWLLHLFATLQPQTILLTDPCRSASKLFFEEKIQTLPYSIQTELVDFYFQGFDYKIRLARLDLLGQPHQN